MAGHPNIVGNPGNLDHHDSNDSLTIFQCEKCRSIIGNSDAFISSHDALGLVTVRLPQDFDSSVTIHSKVERADNIHIRGSSYQRVTCSTCSQEVGAVFKKLPKNMSDMNENLSFYVDQISSYEIKRPPQLHPQVQNLTEMVMKMQKEILKIQAVILNMDERLLAVETCLTASADASASSEYDNGSNSSCVETSQNRT